MSARSGAASAKVFLDTNILVYAFSNDARAGRAQDLLASGGTISAQGLNEFASVMRRKLGKPWTEIRGMLADIELVCPTIVPLSADTHRRAVAIAEKHGFTIFDSAMLAAALEAGCEAFLSEDLHHDMMIGGRLRIENPFRP